jgi:putative ABC transport system substrate-binding protein
LPSGIYAAVLPDLAADDLKNLSVSPDGRRQKLLPLIAALRRGSATMSVGSVGHTVAVSVLNRLRLTVMRRLLAGLGFWLCLTAWAFAQGPGRVPLVGVLLINMEANPQPAVPLIRDALAGLGYVEGRNLRLNFRFAEGHAELFPALADGLVRDKAAVIVALGDAAVRAAQQATRTVPIVAIADDLVASGLIQSMAKPGGNTTGVSILATELDAKKLEILKEIVPAGRRFALLRDPTSSTEARLSAIAEVAKALGLELQTVDVEAPADFAAAFASFQAGGAEAVDILASPLMANFQRELGHLSLEHKLPAICQFREMVEAGCLVSYGVKRLEMYAILAGLVDKMLKGAKPANTVAQQPTAVELVINRKTARKLGITIPPSIFARADEIIE